MPGNCSPVPGMYYEKVYSNSKLLVIVLRFVACFSFDKFSIEDSCEEKMFNK